jgi:NAD(P)H-dependent flavin oxidoreductase YrpB (nitropropane dioxygenase family)
MTTATNTRDAVRRLRANMYSAKGTDPYESVLQRVQKYVATNLTKSVEEVSEPELREAIEKYIADNNIKCALSDDIAVLSSYIYHDMAKQSFISRNDLFHKKGFEELNINAWNAVDVITHSGTEKSNLRFLSPQHAIDIHQRTPARYISMSASSTLLSLRR